MTSILEQKLYAMAEDWLVAPREKRKLIDSQALVYINKTSALEDMELWIKYYRDCKTLSWEEFVK